MPTCVGSRQLGRFVLFLVPACVLPFDFDVYLRRKVTSQKQRADQDADFDGDAAAVAVVAADTFTFSLLAVRPRISLTTSV